MENKAVLETKLKETKWYFNNMGMQEWDMVGYRPNTTFDCIPYTNNITTNVVKLECEMLTNGVELLNNSVWFFLSTPFDIVLDKTVKTIDLPLKAALISIFNTHNEEVRANLQKLNIKWGNATLNIDGIVKDIVAQLQLLPDAKI